MMDLFQIHKYISTLVYRFMLYRFIHGRIPETVKYHISLKKEKNVYYFVLAGNPVRDRSKEEEEMPMSNWTQLADEWLAKASAARGLDVTVLPFTETLRDLPPTAETIRINGTNLDQLSRVRKLVTSLCYVCKFGAFQTFIDRDSFSKTLTLRDPLGISHISVSCAYPTANIPLLIQKSYICAAKVRF